MLESSYEYYVSSPATFEAQNAIFDWQLMDPIREAIGFSEQDIDDMRDAI